MLNDALESSGVPVWEHSFPMRPKTVKRQRKDTNDLALLGSSSADKLVISINRHTLGF